MQKWFPADNPEMWLLLLMTAEITESGEEARRFFRSIEPWERHGPVSEETLAQWIRERKAHGANSYGSTLERDIALARECNARGCEMIVSLKQTGKI